ncbi:GGDEF domain-containing protein [Alicyclobacillus macrosporangiidus]|uniref:GGDEF domain-containing protein n=1 Tax=Alicyclobacillus macrosporangiidus TaxID=392015 RepID=UPI00049530E8|nr:GGDEF domain-containing protein [Alicyclobacillus macrosporangiidus]
MKQQKVILAAATVSAGSVGFLLRAGSWPLAALVFCGVSLTLATVYLRPRPLWRFYLIIVLNTAATMAMFPAAPHRVLETTLYALIISSFISMRADPRLGMAFFGVQLTVAVALLSRDSNEFDPVRILTLLGGCVILCLQIYEVASKFYEYRQLSIYDELTRLHNVRYFRYKLNQLLKDPNVSNVTLIILDLDRFKEVNDTLGHRVGDEVLRKAARCIQDLADPMVVSRYGGEEFIIVQPNLALEDAVALAERIRIGLEQTRLCDLPVTVSCGIARMEKPHVQPEALFDAADRALYEAKRARNCVRVHGLGQAAGEVASATGGLE